MKRRLTSWLHKRDNVLEDVAFDAMLAVFVASLATASLRRILENLV
jgi:hypothetical protein